MQITELTSNKIRIETKLGILDILRDPDNDSIHIHIPKDVNVNSMYDRITISPPGEPKPPQKDYLATPLLEQVGGDHYKNFPIQPVAFITRNNLPFLEGSVIKRVCRHRLKGCGLEDLEKAKHELDLIRHFNYT